MKLLRAVELWCEWIRTHNPSKRFNVELQLMFLGVKYSRWLRKKIQRRLYYRYHCDISHSAVIHPSVSFPHPLGIVIGSNVIVERDCVLYQNVTIGSQFGGDNGMAHVKSNVKIGAGAKLIGAIEVGEFCTIGANAVITKSLPPHSVAIGANKIVPTDSIISELSERSK
ncbi:serine acetyltransferase [Vibrio cidicii]|nr:serine acetyltransferase [Vibrio cidicii]